MCTYDKRLALDLAEHVVAVYNLSNGYERWARSRAYVGADLIERGATQIGIAYSQQRIIVAARGSSQFVDWLDNFLPIRLRWPGVVHGRIHLGFHLQAARVAHEVLATMKELRNAYPDARVYVAGHSLGGALASLLTCVLEAGGVTVTACYTFESPRVGNAEWALWYDAAYGAKSFRVANINAGEQDIVTRLPLSALGWRHVGRPILLSDGHAYESEAMWEDHRRANPMGGMSRLRVLRRAWCSVSAHFGAMLLRELRSCVSGEPSVPQATPEIRATL
jgi:pimeloyl-ACP methyl ester carboxylesterase